MLLLKTLFFFLLITSCFVAVVLQHGSHLLQDNDGVSQMEHEVCVFVCVSGGKEDLMSLLWAIIATIVLHWAILNTNISQLHNRTPLTP